MLLEEYRNNLSYYDQRIFDQMYDQFGEAAIQLLLEANADDRSIVSVILKYWDLPNDDVVDILHNEKIKLTVRLLTQYLQLKGLSVREIETFMRTNMVKTRLRNEHDILTQWRNPEKVYKLVQAKKKK